MSEFSAKLREDGYFVCEFVDENGNIASKTGATADIAIAKVLKYIQRYGGAHISTLQAQTRVAKQRVPYGPRTRKTNATWGRPTNQAYRNRKAMEDIFGEIKAAAIMAGSAAASAANAKISEETARGLIENVYRRRGKYNTYTGNLERAYSATIVQGRNIKKQIFLDNTPEGNPVLPSPRNGRLRVYLYKMSHKLGHVKENQFKLYMRRKKDRRYIAKEYNRSKFRYFKDWERKDGYRGRGQFAGIGNRVSGFGYMAGDKHNRVQSGIVIENTAPYAGAVQAKGYQVLPPNAMLRSYSARNGARQQRMLTVITKKMLQAAKLIP